MCEVVDSIFGYSNHILNSASVFTEEVNSGLYRKYFSYSKLSAKSSGIKSRTLVNEEPYRVTERMTERTLVLCVNYISGNLVSLTAISALLEIIKSCKLC